MLNVDKNGFTRIKTTESVKALKNVLGAIISAYLKQEKELSLTDSVATLVTMLIEGACIPLLPLGTMTPEEFGEIAKDIFANMKERREKEDG